MPVTEQQARALAFLAVAIRPHGAPRWDEQGVFANVMKVSDRSLATVALAVVQAAEDRKAATPGVIPTTGPHWRNPESAPRPNIQPFDANSFCTVCGRVEQACRNRPGDHEFESVAARRHKVADAGLDVHRIVVGLKERAHEAAVVVEPADHPKPTPDPRAEVARAGLRDVKATEEVTHA